MDRRAGCVAAVRRASFGQAGRALAHLPVLHGEPVGDTLGGEGVQVVPPAHHLRLLPLLLRLRLRPRPALPARGALVLQVQNARRLLAAPPGEPRADDGC